ncbi:MAG: Mur ligase family protein [Acidimicrobiaceae bacterium]|nr:Mur ligase family protein [Acidimicrobiaceae bacterium]
MTPVVLAVVGAVIWMPKWWRVAQREHYLPGSVNTTLFRWLETTPVPNMGLAPLGLILAAATILLEGSAGLGATAAAVVIAAITPVGLPLRGRTSKLRFTRRMKTTAVLSVLFWAVALWLLSVFATTSSAAAICSVFGCVAVDAASAVAVPLESRLARRFQTRAEQRLRAVGPLVIAVTGSYGKTSTKEHLAALVGPIRPTVASPASWNNQAGLSRAVNEHLSASTEVFIAEMGTYGAGEIRRLCQWVKPEIVAVTAIGPVHLERMGSIDNIVEAKMEIAEGAATVVLNVDAPELAVQAERIAGTHRVIRCSGRRDSVADVRVSADDAGGDLRLDYFAESYPLASLHDSVHGSNVAVAATLAVEAGLAPDRLGTLIEGLETGEHRARVSVADSGVTVIDNTFNSNPAGARAALATLLAHSREGRSVVITPGMVELGDEQDSENAEFARLVVESGCGLVIVGRTNRRALRRGASAVDGIVVEVSNRDAARKWVRLNLSAGDGVLWENDLPDHYP